jgi:hypothetical protein
MRIKAILIASAAVAVALPAIAQQMAQTQPTPSNQYPRGGIGAAQPQTSSPPAASGVDLSG